MHLHSLTGGSDFREQNAENEYLDMLGYGISKTVIYVKK